jgi:predicted transcriptional regulator
MDPELAMEGTVLRQTGKRAGLSQVDLASRASVTQSVISAYESGQRQPPSWRSHGSSMRPASS